MKFYINGFSVGAGYFMSFGFTWQEIKSMVDDGKVIEKRGNSFSIEPVY